MVARFYVNSSRFATLFEPATATPPGSGASSQTAVRGLSPEAYLIILLLKYCRNKKVT
jgi:hypothetical protein